MKIKGLTLVEALASGHLFRRAGFLHDVYGHGFNENFDREQIQATDWELCPVKKSQVDSLKIKVRMIQDKLEALEVLSTIVGTED